MLSKSERLDCIKAAAIRMQAEKKARQELAQELGSPDTDLMSIEDLYGVTIEGIQKISGGVRYIPVIID